jgi:hypothetical protein
LSPRAAAELLERTPRRFLHRLEEEPDLAETWSWRFGASELSVVASHTATIAIAARDEVTSLDQVTCSCLLSPRCLHVAAVLLRLPLAEAPPAARPHAAPTSVEREVGAATHRPTTPAPSKRDMVRLRAAQRAAAEQAWLAAAALLDAGAQGASLVLTAELLRAVHSCRVAGLPRLSAAGLRTVQQLRDLHAQRPEFRLSGLSWDVYQLLATAHALRSAGDAVDTRWLGEARRGYAEVGSLRLTGVFSEPFVSTAGYAGVVTYLADQSGLLWTVGDVAPGDVERCLLAYVSPVPLGQLALDHRALSRAGMYVQRATAAANRRLGAGQAVAAASADGVDWSEAPLLGLWGAFETQLSRAWEGRADDQRRAGDDLLFVRGKLAGATADSVLLQVGSVVLHCLAPSAQQGLAYRHNLGLLARAAGLEVWAIGRIAFAQPRGVLLLAIGGATLQLPEAWRGRVNLGLDRLQAAQLPSSQGAIAPPSVTPLHASDPLEPLRRRLGQVLLAGRAAASPVAWSGFLRDEATFAANALPTAAELLRRLRQAPAQDLAQAWLAANIYLAAAESRLQREAWLA